MRLLRFCIPVVLLIGTARATQSVLTQANDNLRSAANDSETILTPTNVNVNSFGKLFTRSLDANVNGQVLYVPNLTIQGAVHNVIFCSTSNNANNSPCSVYAFDADDPNASAFLWRTQMNNCSQWTTCTPTIDATNNIIYVLTKDVGSGGSDNGPTKLHALDLLTGAEKTGSPITLQATVSGTGDGSVGGVVSFDTSQANCRPGLLFANGTVYLGFAHNSDSFPYHGWIFKYTYNGTAFTQNAVFNTAPNGGLSGIWHSGKGLASDAAGNIYCTVGNGSFAPATSGGSYGMCVVKLDANLNVLDWFAPSNELNYSNADQDTAGAGPVLIPGTTRLFTGGTKYGHGHLVDMTNLGHINTPASAADACLQTITGLSSNIRQTPNAWNGGANGTYVYVWGSGTKLTAYAYDPNTFLSVASTNSSNAGGAMSVTSNATANAILWAIENNDGSGSNVFHAYSPTNLNTEYWNSSQNSTRDSFGGSVSRYQFPTIVNGKAYIGTGSATIVAYSLLNIAPQITSATANSATQVSVLFDRQMDSVSTAIAANYTLNNGATVNSAALNGDGVTVTLTTSTLVTNTYALTVNSVKSANSDPITPNSTTQFTVAPPPITITPATLPATQPNAAYNQQLMASGGTPNYTFAVTAGMLPGGIMLSMSGAFTGMATTPGNYNFTVTATDSTQLTESANYTIAVSQPFTINSGPTATPNPAYTKFLTTFTAGADANDATFDWNFGDNSAHAQGASVTHYFPSAATYTVTVTAQSASLNSTASATLMLPVQDLVHTPGTLATTSLSGTLQFTAKFDRYTLASNFPMASAATVNGATLTFSSNGLTQAFTFNKQGNATVTVDDGRAHLAVVKTRNGFVGRLTVTLKGTLKSSLSTGIALTSTGLPEIQLVTIAFNSATYTEVTPLVYHGTKTESTARFKVTH